MTPLCGGLMWSEQPSVGGGRFVHRQDHRRFGWDCPAGTYSFQRVTDRFSVQCFHVCVCVIVWGICHFADVLLRGHETFLKLPRGAPVPPLSVSACRPFAGRAFPADSHTIASLTYTGFRRHHPSEAFLHDCFSNCNDLALIFSLACISIQDTV